MYCNEFLEEERYHNKTPNVLEAVGEIEIMDEYGGVGCGDYWSLILHFVFHDVYAKFEGTYSSYEGYDYGSWEDVKEVIPKEKTITVFE